MKITKLGHCALVIEDSGKKLLTDPGNFTIETQEEERGLSVILITHEHGDHMHVSSVKKLVAENPGVVMVSNGSVAKLLENEGIACTVVGDGESREVAGFTIAGFGTKHAEIYGAMAQVENTGYLVNEKFYFPGDNFYNPQRPVDVLALPVAGPWMKISMAIDFAKAVKARAGFGVHDGMIVPGFRGFVAMLLKNLVPEMDFVEIKDGESHEF